MKEASFEYKCRRCGKIELNPHSCEEIANTELTYCILGIKSSLPQAPTLLSQHLCEDGGRGVSDLQGFQVHDSW